MAERQRLPYDGQALAFSHTTVLRVAALGRSGLLAPAETHTIIVATDVLAQTNEPPGWPPRWGGSGTGSNDRLGDYAVDPRAGLQASDLLSVPTVSLQMPSVDDWFGPRGLYNNREDTRPFQTSFEYIPPPHATAEAGPQLHVACGVGSQGGSSSQRNWKDPKSSLRLRFKAEFGVVKW